MPKVKIRNLKQMCPTSDMWYGTYNIKDEKFVNLSFIFYLEPNDPDNVLYRLVLSGTDDFMMGFETHNEQLAMETYEKVANMDDVRQDLVKELGFEME